MGHLRFLHDYMRSLTGASRIVYDAWSGPCLLTRARAASRGSLSSFCRLGLRGCRHRLGNPCHFPGHVQADLCGIVSLARTTGIMVQVDSACARYYYAAIVWSFGCLVLAILEGRPLAHIGGNSGGDIAYVVGPTHSTWHARRRHSAKQALQLTTKAYCTPGPQHVGRSWRGVCVGSLESGRRARFCCRPPMGWLSKNRTPPLATSQGLSAFPDTGWLVRSLRVSLGPNSGRVSGPSAGCVGDDQVGRLRSPRPCRRSKYVSHSMSLP